MSQKDKKLFLLDAYALIYRAHFAFSKNPRISSKGLNTGVPFGFTNSLLEVIQKQEPTHLGVAFDMPGKTFRHEMYSDYKANRQETPEDIKVGIPMVKRILEAFNIPILQMEGYEADDIVGSIAKQAEKEDFTVYMMTPDKDFGQLVDEKIFLYKPAYMGNAVDVMGVEEVKAKWGISKIDQVRDMLGLQGDASDNIPGIPGIGPKTAQKLIDKYGSVEEVVKHSHELKGKQREMVETYGEQGILSKELATINIEIPLKFDAEELKYSGPDEEKLKEVFQELEFRTLYNRIFGEKTAKVTSSNKQLDIFSSGSQPKEIVEEVKSIEYSNYFINRSDHHVISTKKELESLLYFIKLQKEIVINFLDKSQSPWSDDKVENKGISICYREGESYFISMDQGFRNDGRYEVLKEILETQDILKIGHDLKPDIVALKKIGIELKGKLFDTMLAHYIVDPETNHLLETITQTITGYEFLSKDQIAASDSLYDYAIKKGEKSEAVLQISKELKDQLKEEKLDKLYYDVEIPLLGVLADMEFCGVKLDTKELEKMSKELDSESKRIQAEIFNIVGEEFNINSPKQLGVILFEKLQLIDKPKKTKSGQYATGEEILTKLAAEHEIAKKILEFREYQKLKSTYVDALPQLVSKFDGKVHTTFSQAVAATGRLSSNNPNLQNIPIRTERGREIRRAFIPDGDKFTLLSADYSQIELRIMASFSGDVSMINAFNEGRDIHTTTASRIFQVELEDVNQDMRRIAKTANFGIIYGISAFGLAQNLNIARKEAAEIIESYFKEFPAVKEYMDNAINEARENGYVTTILGRKRFLHDINSRNATMRGYAERNAINAPIQGSAADMIKVAMINIQNWMQQEKLKSEMVLQVHDELVFNTYIDELDLMRRKVIEYMESAISLKVPLKVSVGSGENWLLAH